ncbi:MULTISPECIES: ADP-ribosylglycohydrolase family protein [Streptomyces]|uniref:ADP-ribosylglycohydrolase n=1 Tax=Streptomyces cacaoi TaxID=1898 RepID=A0A4Y3R8H5_STRCI|nr:MULTISPECIES: ADP-ribosylglycohydrolase family protein [Streptomyces]NNG88441.1 ADP-ribosylglycohydrolase family protein [Streptomyces cacaoi]QHF96018.1 ADP-ribosylglycohydrolase [Streptomyces sp. NHF165]GEB53053.1 ADP-ribosylglycohydrolase [Streptomyces cacaoi]
MNDPRTDRAAGALYGLALGDALGMPTQIMSRAAIAARFGRVTGFEAGPPDNPVAAGLPAGSVTDDTDQALIVGRLLAGSGGHIDPSRLAAELLEWEAGMRAKGSLDLLGPSTKAALDAVGRGVPVTETGRTGTTNGAAMRVTPVGVAFPVRPLDAFLDKVVESCQVTHDTTLGVAGAAAVAAAVSAAVDGADLPAAMDAAEQAARAGAARGHWAAGADIAARIRWARGTVAGVPEAEATDLISELIGTSVAGQESIPAAFAVLELAGDDPWRACLLAANLGGDCDTIGAMAGAVAGAVTGLGGLPADAVATLRTVNGLDLEPLAERLLALRRAV